MWDPMVAVANARMRNRENKAKAKLGRRKKVQRSRLRLSKGALSPRIRIYQVVPANERGFVSMVQTGKMSYARPGLKRKRSGKHSKGSGNPHRVSRMARLGYTLMSNGKWEKP